MRSKHRLKDIEIRLNKVEVRLNKIEKDIKGIKPELRFIRDALNFRETTILQGQSLSEGLSLTHTFASYFCIPYNFHICSF